MQVVGALLQATKEVVRWAQCGASAETASTVLQARLAAATSSPNGRCVCFAAADHASPIRAGGPYGRRYFMRYITSAPVAADANVDHPQRG